MYLNEKKFVYLKGEFQNDVREGSGVYYYANGDRYSGEWKNQKRNGNGK